MRIPNHPTRIQRMLQSRLKKVAAAKPVLAASFVSFEHCCGKPTCACARGGPKHRGQHVTCKEPGQKTRSVFVPKDLIQEVQSWIEQHRKLKKLLHEIHLLSLALIQTHAKHRQRKKDRP